MIMLDEVDAHLDATNVEQLGKYLESWQNRPQIVLISHKENSVGRSQSLIGVTTQTYGSSLSSEGSDDHQNLNQEQNLKQYVTASTFSVDLRKYK